MSRDSTQEPVSLSEPGETDGGGKSVKLNWVYIGVIFAILHFIVLVSYLLLRQSNNWPAIGMVVVVSGVGVLVVYSLLIRQKTDH